MIWGYSIQNRKHGKIKKFFFKSLSDFKIKARANRLYNTVTLVHFSRSQKPSTKKQTNFRVEVATKQLKKSPIQFKQ